MRGLVLTAVLLLGVVSLITLAGGDENTPDSAESPAGQQETPVFDIERTLGSPALWPDISPCEFLSHSAGEAVLFRVTNLRGYGSPSTGSAVTVAELEGEAASSRVVFRGGQIDEQTASSADVALGIGEEVLVFLNPDRWDASREAYWVTEQDVLHRVDSAFRGPLGTLEDATGEPITSAEQLADEVPRLRSAHATGKPCMYQWSRAVRPPESSSEPNSGYLELELEPEAEAADDGGIHLPDRSGPSEPPRE